MSLIELITPKEGNTFSEEENRELGVEQVAEKPDGEEGEEKTDTPSENEQEAENHDQKDNTQDTPKEATEDVQTKEDEPGKDGGHQEEPAEPQTPTESDFTNELSTLSEETGLEFSSVDDLKSVLKEYSELKEKKPEDQLEVSDFLKRAIAYEQSGGDSREFAKVNQIDADSLTPREALRQKFMIDNSELAKENPEHANRKFEREYQEKYGIITKEPEDDEDEIDKDQVQFAKDELDYQGKLARQAIKEQQASFEPPQKTQEETGAEKGPSEEEVQQFIDNHKKAVDNIVEEYDALGVPLDPNDENQVFNFSIDEETKPKFEEFLRSPQKFLDEIGINDGWQIDHEQLANTIAWYLSYNKIGPMVKNHIKESGESEKITEDLENPRQNNQPVNNGEGNKTTGEKLAAAVKEKRGW